MSECKRQSGITTLGAMGVMFIGLKLGSVIDWPWYIVVLPLLANYIIAAACMMGIGALTVIESCMTSRAKRKELGR